MLLLEIIASELVLTSLPPSSSSFFLSFVLLSCCLFLAELNSDAGIINWSLELVEELDSRLYPLWNRTAGDCLLDSVLQATWGVMDRESTLRRAMADTLSDGGQRYWNGSWHPVVYIIFLKVKYWFCQSGWSSLMRWFRLDAENLWIWKPLYCYSKHRLAHMQGLIEPPFTCTCRSPCTYKSAMGGIPMGCWDLL